MNKSTQFPARKKKQLELGRSLPAQLPPKPEEFVPEYPTPDDTMANMSTLMTEVERVSLLDSLDEPPRMPVYQESSIVEAFEPIEDQVVELDFAPEEQEDDIITVRGVEQEAAVDELLPQFPRVVPEFKSVAPARRERPPVFTKSTPTPVPPPPPNLKQVKKDFIQLTVDPVMKERLLLAKEVEVTRKPYNPSEYSFEEPVQVEPALNSRRLLSDKLQKLQELSFNKKLAIEKVPAVVSNARKQAATNILNVPLSVCQYQISPSRIPVASSTLQQSLTIPRAKKALSGQWKKSLDNKPSIEMFPLPEWPRDQTDYLQALSVPQDDKEYEELKFEPVLTMFSYEVPINVTDFS